MKVQSDLKIILKSYILSLLRFVVFTGNCKLFEFNSPAVVTCVN